VGFKVLYINHNIDNRGDDIFSTHNPQITNTLSDKIKMINTNNLSEVDITTFDVIGVDEAQFFIDLTPIRDWVDVHHKHVIVASLDADCHRNVFGHILTLVPYCDSIVKLKAHCLKCAAHGKLENAIFTIKISNDNTGIDIGGADKYLSVCRQCYQDRHE
jgi:thymidine kinase